MFLTIFLTVWTGMHLYVFWRITSIPAITQHISPLILALIAAFLWSSFLLPRFFNNPAVNALAGVLEFIGANWLGILFLLFFCLLVTDIVMGFGLFFKGMAAKLRLMALLAGVLLSVIAFVQGLRAPVVSKYEITMAGLPVDADGLVIAAISDLHVGELIGENWLEARVRQVNAMKPDLIVVLGDIVEGHGQSERGPEMQSILGGLDAPLGVWAVTGNHDHHGGVESNIRFLSDAGIRVLNDEWSEIRPGIIIAGVNDRGYSAVSRDRSDRINRALLDRPPHTATIFLSHRPEEVERIAEADVGLMLCGHTHGGQIWPFSYIVGRMNRFLAGKYMVEEMPIIVSRGTGTWGPRMRLWAPGEILRITLRTSQ